MPDKCKKRTSTLVLCDEMALAVSHGLVVLQSLHNRVTRTRRERLVLKGKDGFMPLWHCPFCRINVTIPAKEPAK